MAARAEPRRASARHQALHHFVAKAERSGRELLRRVCQWVVPKMHLGRGGWWIIDDTGFPKMGQQDNCQVAVSASLAGAQGSVPVAWPLHLPEDWAAGLVRRRQAGVPEALRPATKTQIALARSLPAQAFPRAPYDGIAAVAVLRGWRLDARSLAASCRWR